MPSCKERGRNRETIRGKEAEKMGWVENYNNPTAYLRGLVSPMISFNGKHLEKSESLYHYKSLLLAIQTVCTGDDILYFCKIPSGNCKYTGAIERINCLNILQKLI